MLKSFFNDRSFKKKWSKWTQCVAVLAVTQITQWMFSRRKRETKVAI